MSKLIIIFVVAILYSCADSHNPEPRKVELVNHSLAKYKSVTCDNIDTIIKKKGIHPKSIAIHGKNLDHNINITFAGLFCLINSSDLDTILVEKIQKLIKSSVRWVYRFISFNIYFTGLFLSYLGYMLFCFCSDLVQFEWQYLIYFVLALVITIIFNNSINNIYLIRSHEKIGIFHRIKDGLIKTVITLFVLAPLVPELAKLFNWLLKYLKVLYN